MMTRISSAITQLILLGSADLGQPAASNAACHFAASQPSTLVEPIAKSTLLPEPGTFCVVNETPSLVTKSLARSQLENFVKAVTKMCTSQVEVSADTVTGLRWANASRSGLTKCVSAANGQ